MDMGMFFESSNVLFLSFFLGATILFLVILYPNANIAGGHQTTSGQVIRFLCEDYEIRFHCGPSLSKLKGFEVNGNWSELYRPLSIPVFVEGNFSKAIELDSARSRDTLEINNSKSINPSNFSISFWVKSLPQPFGVMLSHSSDDSDAGWDFVMYENGTASFRVMSSNQTYTEASDNNYNYSKSLDKFTHIVGTFNGSTIKMYRNGELVTQRPYHGEYIADPGTPLRIGGAARSSGQLLWSGTVDDLALYDRALDGEQIMKINKGGTTKLSNETSIHPVSHWSFDNTLADVAIRNSNDGNMRTLIASLAFAPDGTLFFSEKNTGKIRVMKDGKVSDTPFAVISDYHVAEEQGVLSLVVDPHFEDNHYVYLYYTAGNDERLVERVIRFTDINGTGHNKVTIVDNIPALDGYHAGGALAFGSDDKLYVGVGDATQSVFAQNPSVLLGKVLRINRDGTIPEDNPYPNSPVYTLGHRNIYGIAFDTKSGLGIIAENGDVLYDEINVMRKRGNYGYPTFQPENIAPELANSSSSIIPVRSYWETIAPTQAIFYEGAGYPPALDNSYVFGGFNGDIYSVRFNYTDVSIEDELRIDLPIFPYTAVTSISASPLTGEIYFAGNALYKLTAIDLGSVVQTVFPINFEFSSNFNRVNEVNVFKNGDEKKMTINFTSSELIENEDRPDNLFLNINIPKSLMPDICKVGKIDTEDGSTSVEYSVEDDSSSNVIKLKYLPSITYNLEILGSCS